MVSVLGSREESLQVGFGGGVMVWKVRNGDSERKNYGVQKKDG